MSQLANISSAVAPPPDNQRSAPGFWRRLMRSRAGLLSLIVVVLVVLAALAGPWLYPVDATRTDFGTINAAPSRTHPLGTDRLGHDTLARLLAGLRVSLLVALVVELINIGLGGALGLLAGYFGGWVDTLIARVADMVFAFPGLLLAILVAAVFGQWVTENYGSTARLVLVAASISLVGWPLMARYVRGQTARARFRAGGARDRPERAGHPAPAHPAERRRSGDHRRHARCGQRDRRRGHAQPARPGHPVAGHQHRQDDRRGDAAAGPE
jgi:ABC-type dipeptide/oligopeptide/nickel transport system permease subunit